MDAAQWMAFATVLAWWVVAALAIWRFGPGTHRRPVRCPVKKTRALVAADEREVGFAGLRVLDVTGLLALEAEVALLHPRQRPAPLVGRHL
jgi:hypothetical protein